MNHTELYLSEFVERHGSEFLVFLLAILIRYLETRFNPKFSSATKRVNSIYGDFSRFGTMVAGTFVSSWNVAKNALNDVSEVIPDEPTRLMIQSAIRTGDAIWHSIPISKRSSQTILNRLHSRTEIINGILNDSEFGLTNEERELLISIQAKNSTKIQKHEND